MARSCGDKTRVALIRLIYAVIGVCVPSCAPYCCCPSFRLPLPCILPPQLVGCGMIAYGCVAPSVPAMLLLLLL